MRLRIQAVQGAYKYEPYENILNAKQLTDAHGIRTVLIVSDPLHMKRAMTMARDVGLVAHPSPTPSTRYHGLRSQLGLLAHETYYYIGYLLRRELQSAASCCYETHLHPDCCCSISYIVDWK
ncbi:MAG TPA: YdcF family protein [Pyrinomonadaceae bacterium]|nr:YdcF family protein [Pyrinomonadaceae bacterium]